MREAASREDVQQSEELVVIEKLIECRAVYSRNRNSSEETEYGEGTEKKQDASA
jgi:hypothetical protein